MRRKYLIPALAAVIIAFSFGFRVADLRSNTLGFFCDEASIGYNAYSIAKTGHDEHGVAFPLFFKAFGEYKPPLYIYSAAVSTAMFGKSEFATRLPSALFMSLTMVLAYLLLRQQVSAGAGLIAVAIMAIEPWLNHYSHLAFNLTALPMLLTLSVLLLLHGLNNRHRGALWLSALTFSVAFYTYPPARPFVPLFVLTALWIYREQVMASGWSRMTMFCAIAGLSAVPFVYYLLTIDDFLGRVDYLNVYTSPFAQQYSWSWRKAATLLASLGGIEAQEHPLLTRNLMVLLHYLSYLNPRYLFLSGGDHLIYGTPAFGVLGLHAAPLLALGLISMPWKRDRFDRLLLAWLLLSPIPAALTWESIPHTGRWIIVHPSLDLIAAIGGWRTMQTLRDRHLGRYAAGGFCALIMALGLWHAQRYFSYARHFYPQVSAGWLQYGYREALAQSEQLRRADETVVLLTQGIYYQPYIFALFYSDDDPQRWQNGHHLHAGLEVRSGALEQQHDQKPTLYVVAPFPQVSLADWEQVGVVPYPDGRSDAFGLFRRRAEPSAPAIINPR
ncbi:glycosyltransferase family 39 protein [Sinimarinibacterium sp. CAU 1509]|uniref:ArnT family glycosyltransferase n=1 Tax=Sinimarinibacterium sp. CAU 1509 TaxID=2562283 RepID=UPI0010AC0C0F|nr:glycosyltransferase family 39 protein [Sinimarinibacterium sp. CAU 1509]TJY62129.1 glycosyltransferase family 39 protein [Sinimarinibacterium sp. CAU 1509]